MHWIYLNMDIYTKAFWGKNSCIILIYFLAFLKVKLHFLNPLNNLTHSWHSVNFAISLSHLLKCVITRPSFFWYDNDSGH